MDAERPEPGRSGFTEWGLVTLYGAAALGLAAWFTDTLAREGLASRDDGTFLVMGAVALVAYSVFLLRAALADEDRRVAERLRSNSTRGD